MKENFWTRKHKGPALGQNTRWSNSFKTVGEVISSGSYVNEGEWVGSCISQRVLMKIGIHDKAV